LHSPAVLTAPDSCVRFSRDVRSRRGRRLRRTCRSTGMPSGMQDDPRIFPHRSFANSHPPPPGRRAIDSRMHRAPVLLLFSLCNGHVRTPGQPKNATGIRFWPGAKGRDHLGHRGDRGFRMEGTRFSCRKKTLADGLGCLSIKDGNMRFAFRKGFYWFGALASILAIRAVVLGIHEESRAKKLEVFSVCHDRCFLIQWKGREIGFQQLSFDFSP